MNFCATDTYHAPVEPPIVALGAVRPGRAERPWTVHIAAEVPLRERLRARAHMGPLPLGRDSFSIILAWSGAVEPVLSPGRAVGRVTTCAHLRLKWRMWRPHFASDGLGRARWILLIDESLFARGWHAAAL